MNLSKTKLIGLTMELDLKAREYKDLCNKLENLKENNINPNDEKLVNLKQLFQENHDEIVQINRQIRELKENEEILEMEKEEKYNPENLFKKNNEIFEKEEKTLIAPNNKNIFMKLIEKIKKIFIKE